jgi:GNAT superfamily N-acetyltransferase
MKEILEQDDGRGTSVCRVSVDVILDLRHRLLRAGLPADAARFPGDDEAATWHFGLFCPWPPNENAPLISCASFMLSSYKDEPAWQLRGMATDNSHQGRGFGAKLLACAEKAIRRHSNVRLFWCNARVPAVPFYERQGWIADSEVFEIPTAGPHRRMFKPEQFS